HRYRTEADIAVVTLAVVKRLRDDNGIANFFTRFNGLTRLKQCQVIFINTIADDALYSLITDVRIRMIKINLSQQSVQLVAHGVGDWYALEFFCVGCAQKRSAKRMNKIAIGLFDGYKRCIAFIRRKIALLECFNNLDYA